MNRSSTHTTDWLEDKARTLRAGTPPRVDVYLRSLAPPVGAYQHQQEILDRLYSFATQDLLESASTKVWGRSICPTDKATETKTGQRILERLEEFRSWQSRADSVVELPFESKQVTSSITEEEYRKIILPRICLSVYSEDTLELVLPCEIDGTTYCVDDLLTLLEQRHPAESEIGTSA